MDVFENPSRFVLSRSFFPICALALMGCSGPKEAKAPAPISNETVDAHIRYLSSDEMMGRDAYSPDIAMAEEYIADKFREAGLAEFPVFPGYRDVFSHEYRPRRDPDAEPTTYELRNIVGYIEGTDPALKDEYILFGAHHDHLGVQGEEEDNIYNGADDNAAGTVAVIALAEYFARVGNNKRSLTFATFTAEEKGLVGARHLAANLPIPNDQLICMINIEMIGKPAPDGSWSLLYLGPEFSTIDEIFLEALDEDSPISLVGPVEYQIPYYGRSDNAAFAREGFITTTLASPQSTEDPYYHSPDDHYEYLDIDYMSAAIRAMVDFTESLISGEATPGKTVEEGGEEG